MKAGVAQIQPLKGDIEGNLVKHVTIADQAVKHGADIVIFPELSLTGYEPKLARSLAIRANDKRFSVLQQLSDDTKIVIGVGAPVPAEMGICISMIIFQPLQKPLVYSKKYLHPDEEDYFVHGENFPILKVKDTSIAFSICYELSVAEHAANAFAQGAEVYMASVAKSFKGINAATKRLSDIARKYSSTVLMANAIGKSDDFTCVGKTSAWNSRGELLAHLDDQHEGIIIVSQDEQTAMKKTF